jgi:hypothetical protein
MAIRDKKFKSLGQILVPYSTTAMDGGNADFAGTAPTRSAITLLYPQSDGMKQNLRISILCFYAGGPTLRAVR